MTEPTASDWDIRGGSVAGNYERYLVPAIFAPIAVDFLNIVKPRSGDHVLDVACGTGIVARLAAERVGTTGRVVGLDFLPDMLNQARSLPKADPPVEWEHASADKMPFSHEAFTLVLCQQSLPFFPDKPGALREMHRVTAPGGKLGLNVLSNISRTPAMVALAEALARNIGPEPAAFVRLVGSLCDKSELRDLVEGAGFHDFAIQTVTEELSFPSPEEFVRQYLVSTPLAANESVKQADETARAAVVQEVRSELAPYVDDRGTALPAEIYVVTARK
jgi:ubiquinone/menaquinone biosynthesis C-methylase UbiE